MRKLPVELPGGCFSGGLTSVEAAMLTEAVLKGHIKVLFVSPERLCMPSFRQLMKTLQNERTWTQEDGRLVQSGGVGLLCVE
jgi:superfamily II DNA helicase RecQ